MSEPKELPDELSGGVEEAKLQLDSMQLAEAIQQSQRSSKLNETLIVNNLVGFFNPLISELDENVNSLRYPPNHPSILVECHICLIGVLISFSF